MPAMTSGRVSVSRSLLPRSSRTCDAKRAPRKSASASVCRWIIVPIAPSRTRMREASSESRSALGSFAMWFGSAGDQHRERIARLARADADLHIREPGADEQLLQFVVVEAEAPIAELAAHPFFVMPPQVEDEHAPAGGGDADRLGDGARRMLRMVQRLREHRHVDGAVADRQLLELALLPDDVGHAP